MTTEPPHPGFLTCNQSPDFGERTGGGGGWVRGGGGHMLLIHLHTDRQTGHVTTIPNTPAPRPNPSRAPSCPRLTPADPWRPSVTGLWDVLIGSRGWSGRWGGLRGWDPVIARGLVLSGNGRAFQGGTRGTNMKGFVGVKRIVRKMLFLTPVQVCCH